MFDHDEWPRPESWQAAKQNFTKHDFTDWETVGKIICRESDEWEEDEMYEQYMKYFTNDLTKRIIWAVNEVTDTEITVFIGPEEEEEGRISDFFDVYPVLEEMFPLPGVEIGWAENLHCFEFSDLAEYDDFPRHPHAAKHEVLNLIKAVMDQAGAVYVD